MSQLSYAEQAVAREGLKYDLGMSDVISRVAEGAIPFGKLAVLGTDPDKQADLPDAAGDVTTTTNVLGVAVHSHIETDDSAAAEQYADKQAVSLMRKGRIWVKVEESVTPSSAVFVRYAAGGSGLGSFGASAGTSERAALANARYLSSASADGFAVLELNLE